MSYVPVALQVYNALYAAISEGFSDELVALGQPGLPDGAFVPRHPALLAQETVGLVYAATSRELQTKYWQETGYAFELQLFGFGADPGLIQQRIIYLEYAACQVLWKNRTLGGLLVTLSIGDTQPAPMLQHVSGQICDGSILPITCQPAIRVAIPEHS